MEISPFRLSLSEQQTYLEFCNQSLPRHTSYPAVPYWQDSPDSEAVGSLLKIMNQKRREFSLYIHVPFCSQMCLYCACTKDIYDQQRLAKYDPREDYMVAVEKELHFYGRELRDCSIQNIHLGGGTPTFLTTSQLERLFNLIKTNFTYSDDLDISIEIDPRVSSKEQLECLARWGCSRISMGIQDFDPIVQKAVNRVQSFELIQSVVKQCRDLGFKINFDLIYGLPYQNLDSIKKSLEQVVELAPDRIAFFRLALIPDMFKWQKSFARHDLPSDKEMLEINLYAINLLSQSDYSFIGLDHFARKGDSLHKAWIQDTLKRNFQGMSAERGLNIIGVGPSSISQIENGFVQSPRELEQWSKGAGHLQIKRNFLLNEDDLIRKDVIESLYCRGCIDKHSFQKRWGIDFNQYFKRELKELAALEKKGLVECDDDSCICLTRVLGRLLVRVVATIFDQYYQNSQNLGSSKSDTGKFSRL